MGQIDEGLPLTLFDFMQVSMNFKEIYEIYESDHNIDQTPGQIRPNSLSKVIGCDLAMFPYSVICYHTSSLDGALLQSSRVDYLCAFIDQLRCYHYLIFNLRVIPMIPLFIVSVHPDYLCSNTTSLSAINIDISFSFLGPYLYSDSLSGHQFF